MADEINVGRLVAEIILEAQTDGADEAVDKLKEVNAEASANPKITLEADTSALNSAEATIKNIQSSSQTPVSLNIDANDENLIYIRDVLLQIGIKGEEAERILANVFADTSGLDKYKIKLEEIAQKLEEQRNTVEYLRSLSKYSINPSNTSYMDKEVNKLKELEAEYDSIYKAQDDWVLKQIQSFQKQEAATDSVALKQEKLNQKMSDRKSTSNMNTAVRTLTSSLRTIDTVIPDAIDNIDNLISHITAIKEAMSAQNTASTALAWGSAIVAAIGVTVSLVSNYIQQMQKKQQEAQEKALESLNEFSSNDTEMSETITRYTESKYKLDELNLSRSDEISLKNELIELQKQLNDEYGEEAQNIDLINGRIEEQIENLRKLRVENAKKTVAENYSEYNTAKDELTKNRTFELETLVGANIYQEDPIYKERESAIKKVEEVLINAGFTNESTSGAGKGWKLQVDVSEAQDSLVEVDTILKKLIEDDPENSDVYEYVIAQMGALFDSLPDDIDSWKTIVKEYENAQDVIANEGKNAEDVANAYNALFEIINENIAAFSSLQDAYAQLSTGQALSADTLAELTEQYPQLQKYIAETGDLSLQNGEVLKKVAQETMESNIERVENERAALEAKSKLTDEEKGYYEELGAKAEIYKSQLEALNNESFEELTSSMQSLGNAWAQLEQGKELDIDTTLSLINQYPEFAQAMADGSISIENQADVLRRLWEIKKQEAITSLTLDQQKQQSVINTTNVTIGEIEKQIEAYEKSLTVLGNGADFVNRIKEIEALKADLQENKETISNSESLIDTYEAQINAIENLTIETYNSADATSTKNEALAEELKYMEHLKSLGQLSAADELAWLQRINSSYSQNVDERYDMEKRLYDAEKAWREEQEKAIEDALNAEYQAISDRQSLDQLSKQEELDWLRRIQSQYVLNAEQAMELQIKIYNAEKALREEREKEIEEAINAEYKAINNQKSLDRLTSEEELEWLERIQNTYEMNSDQRIELEIKIHQLKKQMAEDEQSALEQAYDDALTGLERRKNLANINYELEIAYLEEIRRKYKLTHEDAIDLEQRIRDLIAERKEADISAIDRLGEAVTEAIKNKYEQQREIEEERINSSIENWQKWEDETVAAIQGQIDALDDLAEAQQSEDERREYELKRQQLEMQLAYEKDDYNRKQLQKEINRLDNEEADRLAEEEREKQKEALEAQIEEIQKISEQEQEKLEQELEAIGENYDELTSSFNLRVQTEKVMMQSSQKELIDLIKSYAPEYDLLGQSLGDALYEGFASKYKNIETMVQQVANFTSHYQDMLANTANAAADNFWSSRTEYEAQIAASAPPANQEISLIVNFNQPVESPVQTKRALAEVVDNLAAEIRR